MKKKIIICTFLLLIFITAFVFIKGAIESYNYDMDPANGVDIMEGMGAAMLIVLGGLIVFYELDLFYAIYYLFVRPKTVAKSILVILANFTLLLIFFVDYLADAFVKYISNVFREEMIVFIGLFLIYSVLKLLCLVTGCSNQED